MSIEQEITPPGDSGEGSGLPEKIISHEYGDAVTDIQGRSLAGLPIPVEVDLEG